MPIEPSRGMEKLEALYGNIPEGFQEELTLANFAGNFNIKESAAKPKKKEENLDVVSKKLADPMKIKYMARQNSNNTDSNTQSLDFGRALQAVKPSSSVGQNIQDPTTLDLVKTHSDRSDNSSRYIMKGSGRREQYASDIDDNISMFSDESSTMAGSRRKSGNFSTDIDLSYASAYSVKGSQTEVANGRRDRADQDKNLQKRQGTPHTNICSICDKSAGLGKCRCLVCGRVYCKACVTKGMGEMPEGRKCIACVGHRFSQRYIARAGNVGCCMSLPSSVQQAELKWAELGARKPRNPTTQTANQRRRSSRISPTREHKET